MEKLILKSVMYGVDKVPDSWFDKVPGGFYKAKGNEKGQGSQKPDGGDGGKKPRRFSHHSDDRRRTRRDRYEEEHRSDDIRRLDRRGRSSYDGGHDDDLPRDTQRGARNGNRHRRRHSVDSERYGHGDGYSRPSGNAYYGDRKYQPGEQLRPVDPYFDERQRPVTAESSRSANATQQKAAAATGTSFVATAATETGAPYPQSRSESTQASDIPSPQVKPAQPLPSDRARSGSLANNYVPYAHIYGQPNRQPQPTFAPTPNPTPAASVTRSATLPTPPNTAPQPRYRQNPFAQQAPTAADAGAGAHYTGQPVFSPQPTMPMSARAFAGYENNPPYPESPRPGRTAERYSPSYASQPRRDSDVQRARSERRSDNKDKGGKYSEREGFVDPRSPLQGQMNVPPPPSGPSPTDKDTRRDSAYGDRPRSQRHNDRGYTSD